MNPFLAIINLTVPKKPTLPETLQAKSHICTYFQIFLRYTLQNPKSLTISTPPFSQKCSLFQCKKKKKKYLLIYFDNFNKLSNKKLSNKKHHTLIYYYSCVLQLWGTNLRPSTCHWVVFLAPVHWHQSVCVCMYVCVCKYPFPCQNVTEC